MSSTVNFSFSRSPLFSPNSFTTDAISIVAFMPSADKRVPFHYYVCPEYVKT